MKKFISEDNLRESWKHIDNLKQDKLPDGEVGQVLTKTEDGVEWSNYSHTGGESTLPNYIEADKLKTPVMLWGNEFDGSGDIYGGIDTQGNVIRCGMVYCDDTIEANVCIITPTIYDITGDYIIKREGNIVYIGDENRVVIEGTLSATSNITAPNITKIESKLDGVTKAADDSKVIKQVLIHGETVFPNNGILTLVNDGGLVINTENNELSFSVDTNTISTRNYVDDKINFLINSEGELEDSFDTLKEVDTWIKEHEGEAADIISKQNVIENWKTTLSNKVIKIPYVENNANAVQYEDYVTIGVSPFNVGTGTWVSNGTSTEHINIKAATSTKAGVMSAQDKIKLDGINNIIIELQARDEGVEVNINDENLSALINAVTNNNTQTQTYLKIPVSFDLFAYVPTKIIRVDNNADTFYIVGELSGVEYTVTITTHEEETEVEVSTNELFKDYATLNDTKTSIVVVNDETLFTEVNKLYRFDRPVETLEINLPEIEDNIHTSNIKVFFTTGDTPQITINGNGAEIRYFKGYSIQANTTYELDIMWNGTIWVVAQAKVE